jgi:hypothetical protein
LDAPSLQAPVVVELAVAHGFPAQALAFAESVPDPNLRSECRAVWVEAVTVATLHKKLSAPPAVEPVLSAMSPSISARTQARIGTAQLAANDRPAAEKSLQAAQAALGKIESMSSLERAIDAAVPPVEELYSYRPPDPAGLRQTALALAEVARLESGLGRSDDGWIHVKLALKALRASAPSPVAAQERLNEIDRGNPAELRARLRKSLKLSSDDQARLAVTRCRQNGKSLLALAEARWALETAVAKTSIPWGHAGDLWTEIEQRLAEKEPHLREPWWDTAVPWLIAAHLQRSDDREGSQRVLEAAEQHEPPAEAALANLAAKIDSSDSVAIAKSIEAVKVGDRAERERTALEGSAALVRAGKIDRAVQFARTFEDPLLREETLDWTAALACRIGSARPMQQALQTANFVPTEAVSAWRGFLVGLLAREQAQGTQQSPPAPSASASTDPAADKPPAAEAGTTEEPAKP